MHASHPPPQYSFVIVNFNMAQLVRRLVKNIVAELDGQVEFEILIADNSTDPNMRLTEQMFDTASRVAVLSLQKNRGFVDALNQLLPRARANEIMIMHPDVELAPGCMRALSEFLRSNPRAGIVSPDLYYPNGAPNRVRLRMPTIASELRRLMNMLSFILLRRKLLTDELFWDHASQTASETVMSVCMLVRREVVQAIGQIDPRLAFYYANDFLCHQARRLNWTCHYTPAARAIHFERYAPREMYSDNPEMEYKQSTTAANPRMRVDYFAFLSLCYPRRAQLILRGLAFVEDAVQLVAQFKRPFSRQREITQLWASIAMDLGL